MPGIDRNLEEEFEENIFSTEGDFDFSDDDDDDGSLEEDKRFEDFAQEEEEEEQKKSLFEKEEEEEESSEFNEKELESLNKKLGTDFKSIDDLKNSFKEKETQSEKDKEEIEYNSLNNKVSLFDTYIGMDNENLIREQLLSEASNNKMDIKDPDVIDEIEEKIQGLKDLKTLDSMAETLRSNLQNQKEKTLGSIKVIEDKRSLSEAEIARKNTDDLQNAFVDIFEKKEFFGVTISKEDIQDAYESVRTNKFFDSVNGNQEMIAKFAMFIKCEEKLKNLSNKPTHSDKVKDEFNLLAGNASKQRRSIAQANGSASSGSANDNLNAWLK